MVNLKLSKKTGLLAMFSQNFAKKTNSRVSRLTG